MIKLFEKKIPKALKKGLIRKGFLPLTLIIESRSVSDQVTFDNYLNVKSFESSKSVI